MLNNQKCEIHFTFINSDPNEYRQEFHYYPFSFKLDRSIGSCNTLNDLSNKVCISSKTDDSNLCVFNFIIGINESKTSTKHISCKCKCKFEETKSKLNQWWNKSKCGYECKKHYICEGNYVWNPVTWNCENGKYLASIMYGLVITCDEESRDEEIKTILTNCNEKKVTCKMQNVHILLAFLLITIALLIAVSIYCYLIKYQTKYLSPFHDIKMQNNSILTIQIENE